MLNAKLEGTSSTLAVTRNGSDGMNSAIRGAGGIYGNGKTYSDEIDSYH